MSDPLKPRPGCNNPMTLLRQQLKDKWEHEDILNYFRSLGYTTKEINAAIAQFSGALKPNSKAPVSPHHTCVYAVTPVQARQRVTFRGHCIKRRDIMPVTVYVQYHLFKGLITCLETDFSNN